MLYFKFAPKEAGGDCRSSVYVGGTNVLFCGASVGGSGGIVHYRYNGQDCTLSCQLTSSKLYVEDSRGNEPKYARVIRQIIFTK